MLTMEKIDFVDKLTASPFDVPAIIKSPIERRLFMGLIKVIPETVEVCPQFEVRTANGLRKLDFLVRRKGASHGMAIECDGAKFHKEISDIFRDASLLETKEVRSIWRVRGACIHYCLAETFLVMSWVTSGLVSERWRYNLSRLYESRISDFKVIDESEGKRVVFSTKRDGIEVVPSSVLLRTAAHLDGLRKRMKLFKDREAKANALRFEEDEQSSVGVIPFGGQSL